MVEVVAGLAKNFWLVDERFHGCPEVQEMLIMIVYNLTNNNLKQYPLRFQLIILLFFSCLYVAESYIKKQHFKVSVCSTYQLGGNFLPKGGYHQFAWSKPIH